MFARGGSIPLSLVLLLGHSEESSHTRTVRGQITTLTNDICSSQDLSFCLMHRPMHVARRDDASDEESRNLAFAIGYPVLVYILALLAMIDWVLGGRALRAIGRRMRIPLVHMHILSPSKRQSCLPLNTDDWTTRVAGTHGDASTSIHSPSPSTDGLPPMAQTRDEVLKDTLSAAFTVSGSSEPLVPNRPERHAPPRSSPRPPSAPSSHRASLASTAVQTTDDGYTTDATISTLPPSYRTHRSHPDLPSYPSMPERPPLPTASPSYTEQVSAPPSAYVQLGRTRPNHSRLPASAGGCPSYDILLGDDQTSTTSRSPGLSGPTHFVGEQPRAYPRKSLDGGIRLAGGRLDEL